jgi:hypothetical protein
MTATLYQLSFPKFPVRSFQDPSNPNHQIMSAYFLKMRVLLLFVVLGFATGCANQQDANVNAPVSRIERSNEEITAGLYDSQPEEIRAAIAVQNRHTPELMALAGVIGTGVGVNDAGAPVILVLTDRTEIGGIPMAVEGIATRTEYVGTVKAMGKPSTGYKGTYRPVPCGVTIGRADECASGTIGCVVQANASSTAKYALSNNHVFAKQNAGQAGDAIVQPGRYDINCATAGNVGNLVSFAPISSSANNVIDAAIVEYNTAYATTTVNGWTYGNTVQNAAVGLKVTKVGRTTGVTSGSVNGINVTIRVQYDFGVATFVNQIYVKGQFIQSGDSGSLMVSQTDKKPVGLNFAGSANSSYANPIQAVYNYFDVSIAP